MYRHDAKICYKSYNVCMYTTIKAEMKFSYSINLFVKYVGKFNKVVLRTDTI